MEVPDFKPGKNIEKIKTVGTSLFVKGATSTFRGFGDYIATYYDTNKIDRKELESILDIVDSYDTGFKLSEAKSDISSGFLEQKDGAIFFGEHYPEYTKFPEQNRFYRQNIYAYLDKEDPQIKNAGKIFSAIKPFRQYPDKKLGGKEGKFEVSYEEGPVIEINEKLMRDITNILDSDNPDKKLIIKAFPKEGESILGEQALQYPPIKALLHVYDNLEGKQHENFSLFFGDPKFGGWWNKKKILILLKDFEKKSTEEYYKEMESIVINWTDHQINI
jgi:hypothetical protein